MASEQVSLSSLSIDGEKTQVTHSVDGSHLHGKKRYGGKNLLWALVLFIFFWFLVFIILVGWAPKWLRRKGFDGNSSDSKNRRSRKCLDYGKAFLWALVVSVVVLLLFWLLSGITAAFVRTAMHKC
jgi:uncharacterized membrane protein (DUF485 family)